MSKRRTRPADMILDLLRGTDGLSSRYLVDTGGMFGYSENTLRVTLSRLVQRGLVSCPERGRYVLAKETSHLQCFVERWRLGEARVRPWHAGQWIFAEDERFDPSALWALEALGFRRVRRHLLARPDNLAMSQEELAEVAVNLGAGRDLLLISGRPRPGAIPDGWPEFWHPAALLRDYRDMTVRLQESAERLNDIGVDDAKMESFRLGGEAINLMAKDPLLPAEMIDVNARERLWRELVSYDRQGKKIWAGSGVRHQNMPVRQLERA